jgi:hypothetical protein
MALFPDRRNQPDNRAAIQLQRAQEVVYGVGIDAFQDIEVKKIWTAAITETIGFAGERLMHMSDHLIEMANGSATNQYIAAHMTAIGLHQTTTLIENGPPRARH